MPTTKYVWSSKYDNIVAETDGADAVQAIYTQEPALYGNLVSQRRGSDTSYYHFDGLGSTRALTDENEGVTNTYDYDAWGVEKASTGTTVNPFRWVGEKGYYMDGAIGRVIVRERAFEPTIAIWISVDVAGFLDGMNRYRYVRNRPIADFDPSGLMCHVCRWRRYATDESFADLDSDFAMEQQPVQTSAKAVLKIIYAGAANSILFHEATPATKAELIEDHSIMSGLYKVPKGGIIVLRHPIIMIADVCATDIQDCVVTGQEVRRDFTYDFAGKQWNKGQWGKWITKFTRAPLASDQDPENFAIARFANLKDPPVPACPIRIVIYDEPTIEGRFSPNKQVTRKEVWQRVTISDGRHSYFMTQKFTLGWEGSEAAGFTAAWDFTPGSSTKIGAAVADCC
ncbi:MAG: RHS repeat-associated core domain-containing protein [Planctomycetales bacterium]